MQDKDTNTARPASDKKTESHEHKVDPDMYGSGYEGKRNDYKSSKDTENEVHDSSSRNTTESHTHRSGQGDEKNNDGNDDKDSYQE